MRTRESGRRNSRRCAAHARTPFFNHTHIVSDVGTRSSMEAEKGTAWSLEFGAWSLEFGAWSLELGVWSLELGAWSLDGVCHATGEGRWVGCRGSGRQPQRPEVDHVRHKDVWQSFSPLYPATFV